MVAVTQGIYVCFKATVCLSRFIVCTYSQKGNTFHFIAMNCDLLPWPLNLTYTHTNEFSTWTSKSASDYWVLQLLIDTQTLCYRTELSITNTVSIDDQL